METSASSDTKVSPSISKICMLISAISMGHVGLLVSFFEAKYPVYTIVLLRGLFGTLFLTIFLLKTKSLNFRFIKESFKLHWPALIIMGIVNPLIIYFYFVNITISGYSISAFLLYTGGIFFLLFLVVTKEERVSKINIVSFIFAVLGVAIIMEFWKGVINPLGIIYGILSGLTFGILIFYKKKAYNKRNRNNIKENGDFDTFLAWWPTLFIVILFLPIGAGDLIKFDVVDLIFALILGLIPTALAFVLYNVGAKNDKGGNIIILSYIEPVTATIWSIIILQTISVFTIIGGSLIIMANVLVLKYSK
jgi:drug/metabolite transporter (DMT)-like permease